MNYILILRPRDSGQQWEAFGPFGTKTEAGDVAKANYRKGDKRPWVVVPVQAVYKIEQMAGVL